jgi:hypothetical protein
MKKSAVMYEEEYGNIEKSDIRKSLELLYRLLYPPIQSLRKYAPPNISIRRWISEFQAVLSY